MIDEVIKATLMLFVVLDAIGNAPLFYYFTRTMTVSKRKATIRLSIVVAMGILMFFVIFGDLLLKYLGTSINDFRIAGGLILFIYAVLGLLGHTSAEDVSEEEIAVVPLATPLLAGPGSITVVIYIKYMWGFLVAITSLAINIAIAWVLLEAGDKLLSLLGRRGSIVLSKIMSIILAVYAVSMIRGGIISMFTD